MKPQEFMVTTSPMAHVMKTPATLLNFDIGDNSREIRMSY
jgi:hypothetical protein